MKGTEKQVAWATDILNTWIPAWEKGIDEALTDAIRIAEKSIEKGRERGRSEKMMARRVKTLNALSEVSDVVNSLRSVDAAEIIENRVIIQVPNFVGPLGCNAGDLMTSAEQLVSAFGNKK